jgi:hypothetical protein
VERKKKKKMEEEEKGDGTVEVIQLKEKVSVLNLIVLIFELFCFHFSLFCDFCHFVFSLFSAKSLKHKTRNKLNAHCRISWEKKKKRKGLIVSSGSPATRPAKLS